MVFASFDKQMIENDNVWLTVKNKKNMKTIIIVE